MNFLPNTFDKSMQGILRYSYFKVISSLQKSFCLVTHVLIKFLIQFTARCGSNTSVVKVALEIRVTLGTQSDLDAFLEVQLNQF